MGFVEMILNNEGTYVNWTFEWVMNGTYVNNQMHITQTAIIQTNALNADIEHRSMQIVLLRLFFFFLSIFFNYFRNSDCSWLTEFILYMLMYCFSVSVFADVDGELYGSGNLPKESKVKISQVMKTLKSKTYKWRPIK